MERKISAGRFSKVFDEFKRIPFPPSGGGNKDLDDAHASLILYDAGAAGVVTSILDNPRPSEERIHQLIDLQADYRLEQRLEKLIKAFPDSEIVGKLAREYMGYYYEIRKLLHAANSYLLSIGVNAPDWRVIENYWGFADPIKPVLKSALAGEREFYRRNRSSKAGWPMPSTTITETSLLRRSSSRQTQSIMGFRLLTKWLGPSCV